jgi:hypothetical protein
MKKEPAMRKHYDFSKSKAAKDVPHLARLQAAIKRKKGKTTKARHVQ